MKFINESTYWHGTGRISYCLNTLLHEVMGCAPVLILMTVFHKVKIFPSLEELPKKIIPHFITKQWCAQEFCSEGGSTNSVEDRGQREWGSGGGSPLVRGSAQFANE
jgi:hypothetical protein